MPLPNLIIIGAMKCGTTSMHQYLRRHRQVAMSKKKELDFFIEGRNWERGVDWYASQFSDGTAVRGESSPNYSSTRLFPGVPARMHAVVPDCRLLFMVRDPVERLISHWVHNYSHGRESRLLPEALLDERYLDRSLYWKQISAFLDYYPRSRVLVVAMKDLREDAAATLRAVSDFLEVSHDFDTPAAGIRRHRSDRKRRKTRMGERIAATRLGRAIESLPESWRWAVRNAVYYPFSRRLERPSLTGADRQAVVDKLSADAELFRRFAGRDFSDWSI